MSSESIELMCNSSRHLTLLKVILVCKILGHHYHIISSSLFVLCSVCSCLW